MDLIPILSIIFAIISIALTTLTKCAQKSIIRNSEIITIQFDIKSKDIEPKLSGQTNGIKKQMAGLLEVSEKVIDIPKPRVIHQGLRFEMFIFVTDVNSKYSQFAAIINDIVDNGRLVNIIEKAWDLDTLITVENVNIENPTSDIEIQRINTQSYNIPSPKPTIIAM